jgi:hypothetical protein
LCAVNGITFDGGYSKLTLQRLTGASFELSHTVSGHVPLRPEDLVFVHGRRMSYFDAASGEPVVVEDAGRAAWIAQKSLTDRDRQRVLAKLREQVADGGMTSEEGAAATAAVWAARTLDSDGGAASRWGKCRPASRWGKTS